MHGLYWPLSVLRHLEDQDSDWYQPLQHFEIAGLSSFLNRQALVKNQGTHVQRLFDEYPGTFTSTGAYTRRNPRVNRMKWQVGFVLREFIHGLKVLLTRLDHCQEIPRLRPTSESVEFHSNIDPADIHHSSNYYLNKM